MLEYCDMGAASLDENGVLLVQCKGAAVDADGTAAPDYGNSPFMCTLGLTAMPYPADAKGSAEGIVATGIGGLDGVLIAARDTRTAGIVGNLKPGDTVLHSTGPQQASQIQLKEEKRQTVVRTVDTRGKDVVFMHDGVADKTTLAGYGHIVEVSRDNGIVLTESGGAAIILKGGCAYIVGKVVLGGLTPFAPVHNGVGAGTTSIPSAGVFVGV